MAGELHEECGVFGIWSPVKKNVSSLVYAGLYALQHRGQESCGIAVSSGGRLQIHKDLGIVSDVFDAGQLAKLPDGEMAVGHVRYGTTGANEAENAQPILTKHRSCTMALAHNGNLVNAGELRGELERGGAIFHTTSDTELISYVITHQSIISDSVEKAVVKSMGILQGAYSLVLLLPDKLIAVRDEHGFRPLCYGVTKDGSYVVASESCALDAVDAELVRDIQPGEVMVFDKDGARSSTDRCGKVAPSPCIFEYIYFARPDSVIDGHSVHSARLRAGALLAEEAPVEADVVIGVPDSGISAAIGYSQASGIPYGVGLIKNKYIGRTFIAPEQSSRESLVRIKLNPIAETVRGKRVVLIDDSIVRGTTSARIVGLLRAAGAGEIHVRITAPPFLHPCYYGTDVDSENGLIANGHTVEEICGMIGADSLAFLDAKKLPQLLGCESAPICDACFSGRYHTATPDNGKFVFEN